MDDIVIPLPSSSVADEVEDEDEDEDEDEARPSNPREWNVQQTVDWFRSLRILTDAQLDAIQDEDVNGAMLALMATDPAVVLNMYGDKYKLTSGKIGSLSRHLVQLRGMSNNILSFSIADYLLL